MRIGKSTFLSLTRWCVLGTAAATAFGFACGLPFNFPFGSWYAPIAGAVFGVCGGPFFGLAIGLVDDFSRSAGRSATWRGGMFSLAGAIVFGLVPIVLSLGRGHGLDIERGNLGEVLLGLAVSAAAGAFLGVMVASMGPEARKTKDRNGWTELEL
jgi:zinc transporter ZupT